MNSQALSLAGMRDCVVAGKPIGDNGEVYRKQ